VKRGFMRQKSIKDSGIPDFSTDEEAFDWYESHEITDHLEETKEVSPSSVFYQDANSQWFRASDGVLVSNIGKGKIRGVEYAPQSQGRIIYEFPLIPVPVTTLLMPKLHQSVETYIQEGDKVVCGLTTLSSVITLKLERK
jgi:hypothetical protein